MVCCWLTLLDCEGCSATNSTAMIDSIIGVLHGHRNVLSGQQGNRHACSQEYAFTIEITDSVTGSGKWRVLIWQCREACALGSLPSLEQTSGGHNLRRTESNQNHDSILPSVPSPSSSTPGSDTRERALSCAQSTPDTLALAQMSNRRGQDGELGIPRAFETFRCFKMFKTRRTSAETICSRMQQ